MAEIEVRRANTTLSSDHAFDQFATWLDTGVFSKKGVIGDAETSIHEQHPSYLRVHARFSALWSCDVGVFDKAAYERDYNSYIFLHNQWEARGKRDYPPTNPDREAYYRSSKDSGSDEDAVVCSVSQVMESGAGVLKPVEKAYASFFEQAWLYWDRAVEIGEDALPDGDIRAIAHGVAKSVAEERLINRIKQVAGRRADKVSNIKFDMNLTVDRLEVIQIPFWTIIYRHNRKNYAFAIDAVSGKCREGTRPIDKRRVAWAAAAAGVLALGGGAYASWDGSSSEISKQEPINAAEPETVVVPEMPSEDRNQSGAPANKVFKEQGGVPDTSASNYAEASRSTAETLEGAQSNTTIGPKAQPRPDLSVPTSAPPAPMAIADPGLVDQCRTLTNRLSDGRDKLKRLGFDAQIKDINGMPYAETGPIIGSAMSVADQYLRMVRTKQPDECVALGQEGLQKVNSIMRPLARRH